jgi:hypothetical protein
VCIANGSPAVHLASREPAEALYTRRDGAIVVDFASQKGWARNALDAPFRIPSFQFPFSSFHFPRALIITPLLRYFVASLLRFSAPTSLLHTSLLLWQTG